VTKNRLSQIFINLLGNAFKFTNHGGITIVAQETQDSDLIEFIVKDTGMGIKDEHKNRLFQAFGKLDQDDNHINQQGVGLGLTISDTLARLLCGRNEARGIKVESEFGKGSVFSFFIRKTLDGGDESEITLLDTYASMTTSFFAECKSIVDFKVNNYQTQPFKKSIKITSPTYINSDTLNSQQSPTLLHKTSPSRNSNRNNPTILIVDDNPFNIMVATHLVSAQGFNVKSALYGQTAIEIALTNNHKAEPISLVLMDCMMPVMDGYETTRNLRQLMKEGKIPEISIVALTANNSTADKEACEKAGMCDYLTKPLTEASLKRIIRKYP